MTSTPQEYIDAMARSRGSVPNYHKVMAFHDYDVLEAMNHLARVTYEDSRTLDAKTKQLLFILSLTVVRAGREFLTTHMQRRLDLALTSREILEAIELALPTAGIVAFIAGFDAWCEVSKAKGLEPSPTLEAG